MFAILGSSKRRKNTEEKDDDSVREERVLDGVGRIHLNLCHYAGFCFTFSFKVILDLPGKVAETVDTVHVNPSSRFP